MKKEQLFISTTASDADAVARQYGLGIEIAEYCTAWNMDEKFAETDATVRCKIEGISNRVLHAPFNELFPCAIDPKARELAASRYRQAIELAKQYGAAKVITHGGVIAAIMEQLFPNEKKNRYEWQPKNGCGYIINGDTYKAIP